MMGSNSRSSVASDFGVRMLRNVAAVVVFFAILATCQAVPNWMAAVVGMATVAVCALVAHASWSGHHDLRRVVTWSIGALLVLVAGLYLLQMFVDLVF